MDSKHQKPRAQKRAENVSNFPRRTPKKRRFEFSSLRVKIIGGILVLMFLWVDFGLLILPHVPQWVAWIISGLITCVGFLLGHTLSRSILQPISRVNRIVQEIAEGKGDLTQRVRIHARSEIGEFSQEFNGFLDILDELVRRVKHAAEKVADATADLTMISKELTSGAEEQTVKTSDVAASMQQMTAAIYENSQNATLTVDIAEQASQKGMEGLEMMHSTQREMSDIVSSTAKTDTFIQSLSGRAAQIDTIIRTINDIADQTHLLALNAAIEAARAGEQGKGFGVVADEVRKLADRTTKATQEVANTIQAIQKDTKEVSGAIIEVRDVVGRGKDAATKTEETLGEITEFIQQAKDMVIHIAAASKQMSIGAEEISKNLEVISTVTKQSAHGADKMASAAEGLNEQTQDLRYAVGQFRLKEENDPNSDTSDELSLGRPESVAKASEKSPKQTLHQFKAGVMEKNR